MNNDELNVEEKEEVEVKKEEKKDKKEKKHRLWDTFLALPKLIKYGIIILIIITLTSTGVMFRTIVKTNHGATKFGLENVGVLVTQTAHITEVSDTKVNVDFFKLFDIPFTQSRQIFSIRVDVDAAVDFGKITYKEDSSKKKIVVTIPHASIYKATLIDDSLKIYLDEGSLFSRIDLQKHNEARNALREEAINTAKENGIIDAADKNAKTLIEQFIKSNSEYRNYTVEFNYVEE